MAPKIKGELPAQLKPSEVKFQKLWVISDASAEPNIFAASWSDPGVTTEMRSTYYKVPRSDLAQPVLAPILRTKAAKQEWEQYLLDQFCAGNTPDGFIVAGKEFGAVMYPQLADFQLAAVEMMSAPPPALRLARPQSAR